MSAIKDIYKLIKKSEKNLKGVSGVGLRGWKQNVGALIEMSSGADKLKLQNYQNLLNQKQKLLNPPTKKYGGKISPRRAKYN